MPPGEDRDVLEHGLAAVAEAGRLDGADLQRAAELVDHERGQGLALDVFRDDEKGLALLGDLLEKRQEVLHVGDLLLEEEDRRRSRRAHSICSASVMKYGER